MRNRRRGIAIVVVLLVMAVMAAVAVALTQMGLGNLTVAGSTLQAEKAFFAAEAGVQHALLEFKRNPAGFDGAAPFVPPGTWQNLGKEQYRVLVTRGPGAAPNGVPVPANHVYLLATGRTQGGTTREVGVLARFSNTSLNFAAFTAERLEVLKNAKVDAYMSPNLATKGTFPNRAHIGSNFISSGAIIVDDGDVNGTAYTDPGAPPDALQLIGSGNVQGQTVMSTTYTLPPVEHPTDGTYGDGQGLEMPADPTGTGMPIVIVDDPGDLILPPFDPLLPGVLPPGTYESLLIDNNMIVTMASGGVYTFGTIELKGDSSLDAPPPPLAPVRLWVEDSVKMTDASLVNPTGTPGNLQMYVRNGPVEVSDKKASAFFTVYAPATDITMKKDSIIYGSLVSKTLKLETKAELWYDVNLDGGSLAGAGSVLVLSHDRL